MRRRRITGAFPAANREPMDFFLGVDIGTLASKAVLVHEDGTVVCSLSDEHAVEHPQPGWAEHDPEQVWWNGFVALVRRVLALSAVEPRAIAGIGLCGAFPSPCLADAAGRPLGPAILYSDNRAEKILRELNDRHGLSLTGDDITPRLVWIQRHRPEEFARGRRIFNVNSYVGFRLTGTYGVDYGMATWFGGLYSHALGGWDEVMAADLGIPIEWLPPILPADAVTGTVTGWAAKETGLAKGTPVVAGTGDMYLAMLGTGAVEPGEAIVYYGTAGLLLRGIRPIAQVFGRPFLSEPGELAVLAAYVQASGEAVHWFAEMINPDSQASTEGGYTERYASLDERAARISPGSDGVLVMPHFLGERSPGFRPEARGCIYGLRPHHSQGHVFRAILEAFGFAIRHALLETPPGPPGLGRLYAIGGGARSPLWRQVVSDILQREQVYIPKASGALGAAFLAGVGCGRFTDFGQIREFWLDEKEDCGPRVELASVYDEKFSAYLDLYETLESMNGASRRIGRG